MIETKLSCHEMLYNAVQALTDANPDEPMTPQQIIDWIKKNYGDEKSPNTINAQILRASVNSPSHAHGNPRTIDEPSRKDLLYIYRDKGWKVVKYDPQKHGIWEIQKHPETGVLSVIRLNDETPPIPPDVSPSTGFPLESHLRDYIAKNLETFTIKGKKLKLIGTEHLTGVGYIDIYAKDEEDNRYIFELKLLRGSDKALGQVQRYMGWVAENEANGKTVNGIIVAEKINDNLKYGVRAAQNVSLFEYEIKFQLKDFN